MTEGLLWCGVVKSAERQSSKETISERSGSTEDEHTVRQSSKGGSDADFRTDRFSDLP